MYKDDVGPAWFFILLTSVTLYFQIKNPNSKNLLYVGFCGRRVSTKFWDFAMDFEFGMDFET